MKTNMLKIAVVMCLWWVGGASTPLFAQKIKTIDDLFSTYEKSKGINYVNLSPKLLLMMKDANDTELDEVFASIASLKLISFDVTSYEQKNLASKIRTDALNLIEQENFEEIIQVRSDGSELSAYLSKSNSNTQKTEALLIISDGMSEFIMIGITGKISGKVINAVMEGKIGIF